jgi:hypothetical protein
VFWTIIPIISLLGCLVQLQRQLAQIGVVWDEVSPFLFAGNTLVVASHTTGQQDFKGVCEEVFFFCKTACKLL